MSPALKTLFLLTTAAATVALAPQASVDEATNIQIKVRQLTLLEQINPVLLTKPQLRRLLPVVESARQAERDLVANELKAMRPLSARLDVEIKKAKEEKKLADPDIWKTINDLQRQFNLNRARMINEQTEKVLTEMRRVLNEGQLKAAANAIDVRSLLPGVPADQITEEAKLRAWIRIVLLDPQAYDLMLEMSK